MKLCDKEGGKTNKKIFNQNFEFSGITSYPLYL